VNSPQETLVLKDREVASDGDTSDPELFRERSHGDARDQVQEAGDVLTPLNDRHRLPSGLWHHLPIPSVRPEISWRWKAR